MQLIKVLRLFTQEKQASYPEINIGKHMVTEKGLHGFKNVEQLVRKEGKNLQEQVLALLKLVHNTEGKVIHPVQARHAVKVELPQFADKTQQDAHQFLMTILPVLQLPQGSVSTVL